jgi:hypothetical protein
MTSETGFNRDRSRGGMNSPVMPGPTEMIGNDFQEENMRVQGNAVTSRRRSDL